MTAIFTYLSNSPKRAIMACDNLGVYESSKEIKTEKINCLFNRYYIATYGPNMLGEAVTLISDYQIFKNCIRPSNINDLQAMIESMYDIKLNHYARASEEYRKPDKLQGGIIYDSEEHMFYLMDLGQPFSDEKIKKHRSFIELKEGINRFALYGNSNNKYENIDLSKLEKEACKEKLEIEFKELAADIWNKYKVRVGEVGSYLFVAESEITLESCYESYVDYCDAMEKLPSDNFNTCSGN
ncbi:hypothetical protein LEP1GSC036_0942 [Leptospira weilii str. 2006001853]|uniref:Uncharacterized protein n=2 Tax=Leptospira weilii TaxID=28184 RepID=A0A828Z2F9_9LEPT|nr:hypothetical protein [Leptospira weilii]EMM70807.1 hypothetical protein LEP1GSC038_2115 [Leptospira weilii str. 2006001855]EKR63773.1 hypothetical protein LEP1GSC036_0942 [Leptospira weilii str. 2006001853]EMN46806.1 hypothetical protein LEP1GSC086_1113 [Leptospira weilii str. LNT 1234]MCL8268412.1 hypothetical protein [Leptospira weilii]QDK22190.1 hypothetical protein FHG67_05180 [Leptospira weilii]